MNLLQQIRKVFRLLGFEGASDVREVAAVSLPAPAPAAPAASSFNPSDAPASDVPAPPSAPELAPFVPQDVLTLLPHLAPRELDKLEFGCVKVSDAGVVLAYNRWESEFAGVPQETALGTNFFRELAPCTNNRLVFGRFKDGIAANHLNAIVTFAFTYKMKPTLVNVHLFREPVTSTNWVLVERSKGRVGK